MLTEQLTKHAASRKSLESLRFVMFFETPLINLAKNRCKWARRCTSRRSVRRKAGWRNFFLKTVALTGRATQALPEDRSSAHVGILDCHILSGGDLVLSRL